MRHEIPEIGANLDNKFTAGDFRDFTIETITAMLFARFKSAEWADRLSMGEGAARKDASISLSRAALALGDGSAAMQSGLWPTVRNTRFFADRLPRQKVDSARLQIPYDGAFVSEAAARVENDDKPEQSVDLDHQEIYLRSISAFKEVSDESLEDYPGLQSMLVKSLIQACLMRIDSQLISGDGTDPNCLGLRNWPSILEQSKSSDTVLVATAKAAEKIYQAGYSPNLILMNPADWLAAVSTAAADPFTVGSKLLGIDVFVSEASPSGLPTVLDTSGAYFLERSPITLMATKINEDRYLMNITTLRAEQRCAVAITDAAGVCKVIT